MTVRVQVRRAPQDAPVEGRGTTLAAAVRSAAHALTGRHGKAIAKPVRIGPDDWAYLWSGGVALSVHRIRARSGAESRREGQVLLGLRVSLEVDARLDELATVYGTRRAALERAVMGHVPENRSGHVD